MVEFQTLFGVGSGIAITLLGCIVWFGMRAVPGRRGLFPAFLGIWGVSIVLANLVFILTEPKSLLLAFFSANLAYLTLGIYAIHAASNFRAPRPMTWPSVVAASCAALVALTVVVAPEWLATRGAPYPTAHFLAGIASFFQLGGLAFCAMIMAIRYSRSNSDIAKTDLAVVLAAVFLYLPYALADIGILAWSRAAASGWAITQQPPAMFLTCALSALILAVALAILARVALSPVADDRRKYARRLLGLAGISLSVGMFAAWLILAGRAPDGVRLQGPLRLAAAAIMAYAIVKHHAFGIDLAIKWTVVRGIVLGVFAAVFFVVEQVAENYVQESYGIVAGILAAGVVVLALRPLQTLARRIADRIMPGVEPTQAYFDARRVTIYRAAALSAAKDGVVTERERDMLETLVRELKIPEPEVAAVHREVFGGAVAG